MHETIDFQSVLTDEEKKEFELLKSMIKKYGLQGTANEFGTGRDWVLGRLEWYEYGKYQHMIFHRKLNCNQKSD